MVQTLSVMTSNTRLGLGTCKGGGATLCIACRLLLLTVRSRISPQYFSLMPSRSARLATAAAMGPVDVQQRITGSLGFFGFRHRIWEMQHLKYA